MMFGALDDEIRTPSSWKRVGIASSIR